MKKIRIKSLGIPIFLSLGILFFLISNSFLSGDGRTGRIYLTSIENWKDLFDLLIVSFCTGFGIWILALLLNSLGGTDILDDDEIS